MAMLIGPIITLAFLGLLGSLNNGLIAICLIIFYCTQLDMWDPWKPKVARQFLANARKIGL